MTPEVKLHTALVSACPSVNGVVVGSWADRSTWVATGDLSDADRATVAAVIAVFDPDAPSASDIRAEAARRIEARYPVYKQLNLIRDGDPALTEMSDYIDAVRTASNVLEATVPSDYASDNHWPAL